VKAPETIEKVEQGEGTIPVVVLKTDRPDIVEQSITKAGYRICDKIQVLIDLYSSGVGRDAAIRFYRDTTWKN